MGFREVVVGPGLSDGAVQEKLDDRGGSALSRRYGGRRGLPTEPARVELEHPQIQFHALGPVQQPRRCRWARVPSLGGERVGKRASDRYFDSDRVDHLAGYFSHGVTVFANEARSDRADRNQPPEANDSW